uniref:BZIP domain-containing protein n=1 Tax=Bionectria ochroleuca TaxID=29856 RepID=A0A8H7NNT6_BIOOC
MQLRLIAARTRQAHLQTQPRQRRRNRPGALPRRLGSGREWRMLTRQTPPRPVSSLLTQPEMLSHRARKKTRGRPRKVTSGDVGHSERRRQQIREAQRAYRARKDSAITDLEDKLLKAHEKMNNMANEFSKFIDFANTKGALASNNVEVSLRLQDISSKFQTIASESASAGAGHPQAVDPSGSSVMSNGTDGNGHRRILPLLRPNDSAHSSSPSFVEQCQLPRLRPQRADARGF